LSLTKSEDATNKVVVVTIRLYLNLARTSKNKCFTVQGEKQ